jgi:hypothetical protein
VNLHLEQPVVVFDDCLDNDGRRQESAQRNNPYNGRGINAWRYHLHIVPPVFATDGRAAIKAEYVEPIGPLQ